MVLWMIRWVGLCIGGESLSGPVNKCAEEDGEGSAGSCRNRKIPGQYAGHPSEETDIPTDCA